MKYQVSVIIPVYNGEDFIQRAIESVFAQTLAAYELIVVNDGSTDRTAEKLSHYGSRIKVISIPNGGVANARNVGLQATNGNLVAFLDADDIWYQDKLKKQVAYFDKYPEVGFVCCDYAYYDQQLNIKTNHFSRFVGDIDFNYDQPLKLTGFPLLLKSNFVGTCSTVIFKRALIDEVGFFTESLRQSEDYDMWIRFSLVTNFVVMSDELLEKKTHDSNLTNNFLETMLCHEQVLINLKKNATASSRLHTMDKLYRSELGKLRYLIGNLLYEKKHITNAFRYFIKGLAADWTIINFKLFFYFFSRKFLRTISFGLVNKNLIK